MMMRRLKLHRGIVLLACMLILSAKATAAETDAGKPDERPPEKHLDAIADTPRIRSAEMYLIAVVPPSQGAGPGARKKYVIPDWYKLTGKERLLAVKPKEGLSFKRAELDHLGKGIGFPLPSGSRSPLGGYEDEWKADVTVDRPAPGYSVMAWFGELSVEVAKTFTWQPGATSRGRRLRVTDGHGKTLEVKKKHRHRRMGHLPFTDHPSARYGKSKHRVNWAFQLRKGGSKPKEVQLSKAQTALVPLYATFHMSPGAGMFAGAGAHYRADELKQNENKYWVVRLPCTVALIKAKDVVQTLTADFRFVLDLRNGDQPLNALMHGRFLDVDLAGFVKEKGNYKAWETARRKAWQEALRKGSS